MMCYGTCIFYYSNFGKLNYFLGARAKSDGRQAKYPDVDFCKIYALFCVHGVDPNLVALAHAVTFDDCASLIEQVRTLK